MTAGLWPSSTQAPYRKQRPGHAFSPRRSYAQADWVRPMDVGVWLRGLGLAQYEAAFRDNAIDVVVLPKLTAEDLKELGVVVVGHRRKIISAIEELDAASASRVEGVKSVAAMKPLSVGLGPDVAE